jgi:hypothetical protein
MSATNLIVSARSSGWMTVGDIQRLDRGLAADGLDLRRNLIKLVAPAADEGDRRPLLREHERTGLADTRARARHPYDFARECSHPAPPARFRFWSSRLTQYRRFLRAATSAWTDRLAVFAQQIGAADIARGEAGSDRFRAAGRNMA